jgi:hypothetical protein
LACPSLMVPSGGETDVKLGFIALERDYIIQ